MMSLSAVPAPTITSSLVARRALFVLLLLLLVLVEAGQYAQASSDQPVFRSVRSQFIAALGDPATSSGYGAESWGLWRQDPGPRGVRLNNFEQQLVASGGVAPASWTFDSSDWWLEENGLIMEQPVFSLPPGKYIVTGNREAVAMLTIHPTDDLGRRRWELGNGATLHDVTHLACRSARYTPATSGDCSPASARRSDFPVTPGGIMPAVEGCRKQDYSVLFLVAEAVDN